MDAVKRDEVMTTVAGYTGFKSRSLSTRIDSRGR